MTFLILRAFFLLSINSGPKSCKARSDLSKVDAIEIHFFKGKQPSIYTTKKNIDIFYLKDLIINAKNNPKLQADTTGEIIYLKNHKLVFKAYFCTAASESKYKSAGVVKFQSGQKNMQSLLNYGSGMLIDEEFYQRNKQK